VRIMDQSGCRFHGKVNNSVNIELTCGVTLFIPLLDCEINFLMTFDLAFVTLTIVVSSVI